MCVLISIIVSLQKKKKNWTALVPHYMFLRVLFYDVFTTCPSIINDLYLSTSR